MNTVNDKKLVGGMFNSIGFSQQDLASIKYIFLYLNEGLKEISFESDDDFCLVLDDSKRIKVQVKINTLTTHLARQLSKKISYADQNIIIGTGYDDNFRNILQYKNRHLNNVKGEYYDNKDKLHSDWEEYCKKINIDSTFLLKCDFDIMDGINSFAIARDAINQWAEQQMIFIDTSVLLNKLKSVISDERCKCGHLSATRIRDIIFKHRNTRIEVFNKTFDSRLIIEKVEEIIRKNPYFENIVLSIKYSIESQNFVEAKNRIADCLSKHILETDFKELYLWILNVLGEHSYIIEHKSEYYYNSIFCNFEFSKAHYNLKEWDKAREYLKKINKESWGENIYFLSALIYISKRDTRAQRELSECLKINDSYIEALIMLGEITSETNPTESVKYFEKALYIDKNCASAYYGLAVISEKAGDFECALDYYNEYAAIKSTDEIQSEIIAKIAIFSFLCNKSNWELSFQKLNKFFKKQEQISGNVLVIIPIMGSNKHYIFLLHSKEDGFSVTYDDKIIFEYELSTSSRSSIGVSLPNIDFSLRKGMYKLEFINQDSFNPARLSDRAIMEETALPTIIRECSNLEGYEDTLSKLLATDKLRFNHKFKNDDEEYIISDEDITIKMEVTGSELIGNIRIQNILIKIWIPNIGEGFQAFKKQLSRDCFSNDACIIIKYKDFNTILRFNKKVINIKYYD